MNPLAIACLLTVVSASTAQDDAESLKGETAKTTSELTSPQPAEPTGTEAEQLEAAPVEIPRYVPPRRGAPKTRVGGGSRSGGSNNAPQLVTLSPEHTGLTGQASPTLYWWLSDEFEGEFELVVTAVDAIEPALRVREAGPRAEGIHAFSLAEHGLTLEPNRLYQWSVAIVRDASARSMDVVSVSTIERVSQDPELSDTPAALASAGLFYDSLAAVEQLITEHGNPLPFSEMRASLLEQVALPEVARWQRSEG